MSSPASEFRASDVARALLAVPDDVPVEARHILGDGRNSRIYRILSGGRSFALKQYPSRQEDPRDRLGTEVGALRLMEQHGIENVPRVVGIDQERWCSLLSWIDGELIHEIGDADIDSAIEFLGAIHSLRHTTWAMAQPLASEACFSGAEIERQIVERLKRLQGLSGEPALADFIGSAFLPAFERELSEAKRRAALYHFDFVVELSQAQRTLVPSDFGFHNSLRRPDGTLVFIDFEYFGWDDPVKLTADVILHPGKNLAEMQRKRFRRLALSLYENDHCFGPRLSAYLPLFGLRWVLILLNEFIPERWRRRVLAGESENWAAAKSRQLGRAVDFLMALPEKVED